MHQLWTGHLDDQIHRWQKAATIREFVTAATSTSPDSRTAEWLSWAAGYADAIDPFVVGIDPPEIPAPPPRW